MFRSFGAFAVIAALGGALAGCTQAVTSVAQAAWEDRNTEDQVTDRRIGVDILAKLNDRDRGLILDLSSDVWEGRLLLTGTLSDARQKADVIRDLRGIKDVKALYDEVQIVPKADQDKKRGERQASQGREANTAGQAVDDFVIESKIKVHLLGEKQVTSVNYRWRAVNGTVSIIGRAGTQAEKDLVLRIVRSVEAVRQVKEYIQVKPVAKK
ncbi:MAG: BON domain-containing protein [Alphaproteobacteria bacterium]|nr:BON domain-containing protein [Alphaproteobacteria bacterium]